MQGPGWSLRRGSCPSPPAPTRCPGRAAAGHGLGISRKRVLAEKVSVAAPRHLGQKLDARLSEALPVVPAAVGAVTEYRLKLEPGIGRTLLGQLQAALVVWCT